MVKTLLISVTNLNHATLQVNLATPMIELSTVYGNDAIRARQGREMRGGRLLVENDNGREFPPSGSYVCVPNQIIRGETRCHNSRK